jgi:hypothetical protein
MRDRGYAVTPPLASAVVRVSRCRLAHD